MSSKYLGILATSVRPCPLFFSGATSVKLGLTDFFLAKLKKKAESNKRWTHAEALCSSRKLQRQFLTFCNGKNIVVTDTNSKDLCSRFDVVEPRADYSQVFLNLAFNKGILKNFVYWCFVNYGQAKTIKILEKLQRIGFSYATKAGISLSIDDLKIPPIKAMLLTDAEKSVEAGLLGYKKAQLTGLERFQRIIETWHKTSESLKDEMIDYFRKTDTLNPVYMMAFSGARGNISQVRQLVSMRGLMSDPQGKILSFPIQSNFREGLTLTEYVISCYGARKGVVDTALRTANAGYLTRRLVDVAQHVIVLNFDCGTKKGFYLTEMTTLNKTLYPLRQRLIGRVLAADVYNLKQSLQNKMSKTTKRNLSRIKNGKEESRDTVPMARLNIFKRETQQIMGRRNQEISEPLAQKIAKLTNKVFIRSPLTCATPRLVCQLCYGWSLSEGYLVSIGEAVGIIAAQSIGEPGTQLTMRTFHTGGVFSGEMFDQLIAPYDAIITYSAPVPGTLIRTTQGKIAFLMKGEGQLSICKFDDLANDSSAQLSKRKERAKSLLFPTFKLPPYTVLFVRNNEKVLKDQLIAELAFLSSKIAQKSETAEFILKSELEGQIYSGSINVVEKYTNYNDIITQSKDWGTVWLLSGKICQLPLNSAFFALPGDLVDETSVLSEVKWFVPVKTLLDTNSVIKPIKKERYYDFSLNKHKWSTFSLKLRLSEVEVKQRKNKRNLDNLTFLFNLKLQNADPFFLATLKKRNKKNQNKTPEVYLRSFLGHNIAQFKNQTLTFQKKLINSNNPINNRSFIFKFKMRLNSVEHQSVKDFSLKYNLSEPDVSNGIKPLIKYNIFNTSSIKKSEIENFFSIKNKININLPLILLNIDKIYYKNFGYFFSFVQKKLYGTFPDKKTYLDKGKEERRDVVPMARLNIFKRETQHSPFFSPLTKLNFSEACKKEGKEGRSPYFSPTMSLLSSVRRSITETKKSQNPRFFSHEKFNNFYPNRLYLDSERISDQQFEKQSFLDCSSDVFFVPKLLEQRTNFWQRNYGPPEIAKEEDTHLFSSATPTLNIKYQNRLSKDLFHWFPKRYLTVKGGICIYSFNYDSLTHYSNFLNNLNYLETKTSNSLKSKVTARILWVNNYFSPKKMYTVKIGNKMSVKHTDKSNSSMPKIISKFDFPFIFEKKSLFLAGLNIFKAESKDLWLKYILDSQKVGKKLFVRNGYTTLKSFCFKQKEIKRTTENRKNELWLFSLKSKLREPHTFKSAKVGLLNKPTQRKPQLEVNSNAFSVFSLKSNLSEPRSLTDFFFSEEGRSDKVASNFSQVFFSHKKKGEPKPIETNLNSKYPVEFNPFRSSLQGLDKNVFIYKIKNLVSAISLHKKILFPGQKLVDDLSFDSAVYVTCFPEKNLPHNKKSQKNGKLITNNADLDQFSVKKIISKPCLSQPKERRRDIVGEKKGLRPSFPLARLNIFKRETQLCPSFPVFFLPRRLYLQRVTKKETKMKQSTFILLIRKIREYPVYQSNYYKKLLYQSHKTTNSLKFNSKVCTKIAKSNYHSELLNKQYPSLRLLEKCAKIDLLLDLSYKGLKQSIMQNLTTNLINFNFYRKFQLLKTFQFGYFPLKKLKFVQNRAALFLLHSSKEKLNVLLQKGQIQFHSENPLFSNIEAFQSEIKDFQSEKPQYWWQLGPQSNVHKSEWYQTPVDSPVTSSRRSLNETEGFLSNLSGKVGETKRQSWEDFVSEQSPSLPSFSQPLNGFNKLKSESHTEVTQTYVSLVFSFFYKRKRTRSCNFVSKGSLNDRTKKRRVESRDRVHLARSNIFKREHQLSSKQKQSFDVSSTIFDRNSFITSSNIEFLTKSSTQLLTCGVSARQKTLLKPKMTKLFKYNSFQESKLKATFKRNSQLRFKVSPFQFGNSSNQKFVNSIDQKSEQVFNAHDSFFSTPRYSDKVVKGIKLKVFNEIKRTSNYSLSIMPMHWNESKIALIHSHNNTFKHWKIYKGNSDIERRSKFYVWTHRLALVIYSVSHLEIGNISSQLNKKTNNLVKAKDPQGLDTRFFSDIGHPLLNETSDKNERKGIVGFWLKRSLSQPEGRSPSFPLARLNRFNREPHSPLNLGFLFGSSFFSDEKITQRSRPGLNKFNPDKYVKPREPLFNIVRGSFVKKSSFIEIGNISIQRSVSTKSFWNRNIQEEMGQQNNFKGDLRNPENLSNLERAFAASGVNFLEKSSWGSSSNGNGTGYENASITNQTRSFIFLPFSSLVGSIKQRVTEESFNRNRNDFAGSVFSLKSNLSEPRSLTEYSEAKKKNKVYRNISGNISLNGTLSYQFTRDARFLRLFQKKTNQNSVTIASGSGFSLLYQKPQSFPSVENKKNEYCKKHFLNSFSFFNFLDKKIKNFSQLSISGSRPNPTSIETNNNEVQDWNYFSKNGSSLDLFFSEACKKEETMSLLSSVRLRLTETKKSEKKGQGPIGNDFLNMQLIGRYTNPNDLDFKNSSFYSKETPVNKYSKKQILENTFTDLFEQYLPRKKRTTVYNYENLQINPNNMSQISWQPNCYFNYDQKSHFPYFSKSSLINSYFVKRPGSNNIIDQTKTKRPLFFSEAWRKEGKEGCRPVFFDPTSKKRGWLKRSLSQNPTTSLLSSVFSLKSNVSEPRSLTEPAKTNQHFDCVSGFGNKNNFKNYSLFSQFLSIFIYPNLKGKNLTLRDLTEFVFPSNHDFSLLAGFFHQPCLYAFFSSQVAFGHNDLMVENPYLKLSKKGLKTRMAFKSGFCSEQGELVRTSYLSPFKGEILRHETYYWSQNTQRNRYLFLTKNDQISLYSNNYWKQKKNKSPQNSQLDPLFSPLIQKKSVGQFITQGDYLKLNSENVIISSESGILIHYNKFKITLRKAQSFFLSPNCIFHYAHGDLVEKNKSILSLPYQQLKTGDIVQGIPKVEQLLEARSTFKGKEEEDNLHTLLIYVFELYKKKFSLKLSVRKAFSFIQLILVNSVQRIYRSQGVNISDKHLEVIVKQMTSKVQITSRGDSSFFRGEYIDLYIVETWNSLHPQLRKICYKPILLGISRSSLEVNSFLSAASFQHTKKVLSRSAFKTNIDFLNGLKENVIIGNLISAGTGILTNNSSSKQ